MLRTGVRRLLTLTLTLTVGGLAVVALGATAATAATHATTVSVVSSAESSTLGPILVAGTTVYTLQPSRIGCNAACLRLWPPALLPHGAKRATAGAGVDASKLGTAKAAKGALQITYAGKRLYWSAKDKGAGQVHGNVTNKWGKWSTVTAASTVAATAPAPTTATAGEAPVTVAPQTAAPQTAAPQTAAPQTAAPETAPPATEAPQTSPPATQPPATQPKNDPGNGGFGF